MDTLKMADELNDEVLRLQAINAQLLEALKMVDAFTSEYAGDEEGALMHIQNIARDAILKAKSGP